MRREQEAWHEAALTRHGAEIGSRDVLQLGDLANRHPPELRTRDRLGHRIDAVDFHPSWHQLLTLQRCENIQALPWAHPPTGAHVARSAAYFLQAQAESGSLCPITMTYASIPLLQQEPELFGTLRDKLYACSHDPRDVPIVHKQSIMIGMGMTEKQGGSTCAATRRADPGGKDAVPPTH